MQKGRISRNPIFKKGKNEKFLEGGFQESEDYWCFNYILEDSS